MEDGLKVFVTPSSILMYYEKKEILQSDIFDSATFSREDVEKGIHTFNGMKASDAIRSGNPILEVLALLDIKTGKRTLDAFGKEISSKHLGVQKVYNVRTQAEDRRRRTNVVNAFFKSKNTVERQISNLAHSPFVIDGRECASIEGFYQGIKRAGMDIQDHVFATFGMNAKKQSKPTKHVYFGDFVYEIGSDEHHELIYKAQLCKYTQHQGSREALLSTGNARIRHKAGRDSEFYPARVYCRHLTQIRSLLQKGRL
jgi:predicted NAD-dependent protein-ADP-ribosyltransferase YbiA (DUF1768 family)